MDSKRCKDCNEEKPATQFNWKNKAKGKLQPWCKDCWKIRSKRYYQEDKEYYQAKALKRKRDLNENIGSYLMEHPCVDCGESDPVVLTFDHVRGDKTSEVSTMKTSGTTWEIISEEIAKCDVRCFNCHARKTSRQCGWMKANLYGLGIGEPPKL